MRAVSASLSRHLNRTKTPLHENVIYMEGSRDTSMAEVAMQYTDSYSELMLSFANNINTTEGGTHETGFKGRSDPCTQRLRQEIQAAQGR